MGETFLQVTTALPPYLDGIGDHAALLARRLAEAGNDTRFVAVSPMTVAPEEVEGSPAHCLQDRARRGLGPLLQRLSTEGAGSRTVLVHYSPAAYDPRGVPGWLANVLAEWKERGAGRRVLLILHEFLAPRPARRLELAHYGAQKRASRRLLDLASVTICSNRVVEEQVRALAPAARVLRMPVYSNLGEPDLAPDALAGRDPGEWVAFGSIGRLRRTLTQLILDLPRFPGWCRPRRFVVGGGLRHPDVETLVARIEEAGVEVDYQPAITAADASRALRRAAFSYQRLFANVRPWYRSLLFKSGIFAAATAHGVISVFGDRLEPQDVWEPGHPGIVATVAGEFAFPEPARIDAFRLALHAWYRENASSERFARALLRSL